jgi:signal transduction histidine kinase
LDDDGEIEISVNDTGVGLPLGKVDQIFDAFFTTKPEGSGMGLAISRSIVESHEGRIWAESDDGTGATFHFTLPVAYKGSISPTSVVRNKQTTGGKSDQHAQEQPGVSIFES